MSKTIKKLKETIKQLKEDQEKQYIHYKYVELKQKFKGVRDYYGHQGILTDMWQTGRLDCSSFIHFPIADDSNALAISFLCVISNGRIKKKYTPSRCTRTIGAATAKWTWSSLKPMDFPASNCMLAKNFTWQPRWKTRKKSTMSSTFLTSLSVPLLTKLTGKMIIGWTIFTTMSLSTSYSVTYCRTKFHQRPFCRRLPSKTIWIKRVPLTISFPVTLRRRTINFFKYVQIKHIVSSCVVVFLFLNVLLSIHFPPSNNHTQRDDHLIQFSVVVASFCHS